MRKSFAVDRDQCPVSRKAAEFPRRRRKARCRKDKVMSHHALELVRSKGNLPARYGNFIGGKWVAPVEGQYFTDYSPINGERLVEVAKSTDRDVEACTRRGLQGQGRLGAHIAGGAGEAAQQGRRPHGGESRTAGTRRDARQWQANPRNARRRRTARHRPLPLLRRLHPRRGRHYLDDRRRDDRLSFQGAAGCRRPDHPMELPAADGGLEDRPGACRRQLHGHQAGLQYAA